MQKIKTEIAGLVLLEPRVFPDARGFFMEAWQKKKYQELGVPAEFVQDNLSFSSKGTLRGLHFQKPKAQGKLVHVLQGEVFDVAVDLRPHSPTFGKWEGFYLSSENRRQLYLPEGFAHGFCVTSETALFFYKCTDYYDSESEKGLIWSDPDLDIRWPEPRPVLSEKDQAYPTLKELETKGSGPGNARGQVSTMDNKP